MEEVRLEPGTATVHEQRGSSIQPVHELAVRQRDKQREHGSEMDDEQPRHHRFVTQHEQREAGQRREEEQRDERFVQSVLRLVGERGVAPATQNPESERSNEQAQSASVPRTTGRLA